MNTTVISINNQKGGVGKTTTTISMAAAMAKKGYKVLLVDCDGSSISLTKVLSKQCSLKIEEIRSTLTDLMIFSTMGKDISELAENIPISCIEDYDFIPADSALVSLSAALSTQNDPDIRFKTLRQIINQYRGKYDYILLDAPPVLDLFNINQLVASDELIVVSSCQGASIEAIHMLLDTVKKYGVTNNPELKIRGILLTMLNRTSKYGSEQIEATKEFFPEIKIFNTVIPQAVEGQKYFSPGFSVLSTKPSGKIAKAYTEFVEEYLNGRDDEKNN